MRKLLYSILIFPLLLAFVGCNNLLDIKPVNSMIPVSIEDFESLLIGGYPKSEFFMKTEYSTDNVYANLNTMYGIDKSNEPFFVWASTHGVAYGNNRSLLGYFVQNHLLCQFGIG